MKKGAIIGGVVVVVVLIVVGTFVSHYNKFVSQGERIDGAWAQIESQLKRRTDLIPNLVSTVKGYMEHEKDIFKHLADARAKLAGATTIKDKMGAYQEFEGAFGRLLAVFENYPVLKANESFNRLIDELAGTENRIAVERMRYNEAVREYNMSIKRFPGNFFAGLYGREDATYFEVPEAEQVVPEVKF